MKTLLVRIGLKDGRMHAYPDFNSLDAALRADLDWASYVDRFGGWHYDQVAGHDDHDPGEGSPRGTWLGMLVVPDTFADAALTKFPDTVSLLDETESESFYELRAHTSDPIVRESHEVLQRIINKRTLGIPEDQDDINALNPDHPAEGRRVNRLKKWAGFKAKQGIDRVSP